MRRSIKVSGGRVWIKMIYAGGGRKQQVKTNRVITADKTTQSGPQPGAASLPAGEWRLFVLCWLPLYRSSGKLKFVKY